MGEALPASLTGAGFRRLLQQCVHCGLCLSACPSYAVTGLETDSPRGRLALIRAAAEGRIELDGPFRTHIDLCLACRACETACPSGVQFGALLEDARAAMVKAHRPALLQALASRLVLREMLPHIGRLYFLARLLGVYQGMGLSRLVRQMGFLPRRLRAMEALLPPISNHRPHHHQPAPAIGAKRGKVAFFHGCIQEAFLSRINEATIRVLQRNGYEVHSPAGQTCCGSAQIHAGETGIARDLARRNVDAFLANDYDAIINNAGGCGSVLKEYARLLADDPAYAVKAGQFAAKVWDVSDFLLEHLYLPPTGIVKARATYADSCHLRHVQKVVRQPRDLLRAIPGLELVELKQPERCCGSAGLYNIMQVETANAVLGAKMADIAATNADTIVTTNPGCYLQLTQGVRQAGLKARVVHIVEILDQSYAAQN